MTNEFPPCPRCDRPLARSAEGAPTCRYCGWNDGRSPPRRQGDTSRSRSKGSIARGTSWLTSTLVRLALVFAVLSLVAVPFGGTGIPVVDRAAGDAYSVVEELDADLTGTEPIGGTDPPSSATENGSVAGANASDSNRAIDRAATERYIHEYINDERTERGLQPLEFDPALREVARYYSARMAREDFFAHTAPDGATLSDRYDRFGYDCRVSVSGGRIATGGENLAYTYYEVPVNTDGGVEFYDTERDLARGIVDGWMNSQGHRENLLQPYWEHEGIGVYAIEDDGRLRVYATQHFC